MKYYQMYPKLYTENYCFNNQWEKNLLISKYKSLADALNIVKDTHILLRENNWYIYECFLFGLFKRRLSIKSLYDMGLLSHIIGEDNFGTIYSFKKEYASFTV